MPRLARMLHLGRQRLRSIACLALCMLLPVAPTLAVHPPRVAIGRATDGPGWYDSSWELSHGLDMAEVPDLEAELSLWLAACLCDAPVSEPA